MKVDFNQIKTTISLPDFLLELGWKIVEGSSNSCPKMSNGTHTIVIKRNSQNQYTYWDVHSDSVRGRSIMDLMQEHLFETTGKMPTLREVGEILQNYINTNRITTPEKSRYEVGNTSKLKKYFPKNTTPKQMEETIIKLLERELQRKRNRDSR